jgi:hypothetical protein
MKLGQQALAALLIVLAGCGSERPDPSMSERIAAASQAAPGVTADVPQSTTSSPPGVPSESPSPSARARPREELIGTVRFAFANRLMEVAIVGEQGLVVAWRGATDLELGAVAWDENPDIGLGQLSDRELVLDWIGTVCDVEATLIVAPGSLVVSPPPREGCDAMAVGRGIVLTYATRIDPADVDVRLMETVLLPESS